ncbi:hypothetical protein HBA54_09095 [Pelagibius litoralis]|uniref:Nuclease n=1 Tax=Pelagibius litoralis TaxID=374515 RepID=A0A967C5A2_9PROT|nr:hypothetical protein [Pelagibius litoralis]NIA68745.1 hypothetical protein [Pelagibius litoralis]
MPFTLIKGAFVPQAGRPDGDSLRFRPDTPDLIFRLRQRGRPPKINENNGTVQLRYEGIDTMESRALQPFSSDATRSNLAFCGVPDGEGTARGHILANQLGPNGRPIAFVFPGDAPETDGTSVFLEVPRMKDSANFHQITQGHAYPLFYDTLFFDLRNAFSDETKQARQKGQNVWSADVTNTGALWQGPGSEEAMQPLFPKLWRRLDSYGRDADIENPDSLGEFRAYLEFEKAERVFDLTQGRATGFDNLVTVEEERVSMATLPEELVFVS